MDLRLSAALTLALFALGLSAVADDEPAPRFVAVGQNGARLASSDGIDWKHLQIGKEGEVYRAVSFGNGRFVAVGSYGGNNIYASSPDGASWKTGSTDAKYAHYLRGLGFGQKKFVGLGGDPGAVGSSRPFLMESSDGLDWSAMQPIPGANILRRLAFGNGLCAAVGDRGRRAASKNLRDWKDADKVKAVDTLVDIAFGNGVFVGVGLHGLRMVSKDGVVWTDRQIGDEGEHLNTVVWADKRFVAVGMGATYSSTDGVAWERRANRDAPLTMTFGNGVFVGAKWRGRLLHSTDAVTWKQVHQCEHHIEAIAFGGKDR